MAGILDIFAEQTVPTIFSSLNAVGLTETMNILRDSIVSDGAGGQIKSEGSIVNDEPIPCTYRPRKSTGTKAEAGGRIVSIAEYDVMFPAIQNDEAVDIKPSDRIQLLARGMQVEKLFRIIDLPPVNGVTFQAVCQLENNT